VKLRPPGGNEILQHVGENFPQNEKVARAFADVDISDRLALDAASHEASEKVAVGKLVVFKKACAHGGNGAVCGIQPALVQVLRQIAADLALGKLRPAKKSEVLAPQKLLAEHLLALGKKARARRDVSLRGQRDALVDARQQHLVLF